MMSEPADTGLAPRVALGIMNLGVGGAQRASVMLARGLTDRGVAVDILAARAQGEYAAALPDRVKIHEIGRSALSMYQGFKAYGTAHPDAVLVTAQTNLSRVAGLAKATGALRLPLVIREPNRLSGISWRGSALLWKPALPMLYRKADSFVAVSGAGADDLRDGFGLPPDRIVTIGNAVDSEFIAARMAEDPDCSWLAPDRDIPTILAVGRMTEQKGFDLLLPAFAAARATRPMRLILLGEGEMREALTRQAADLGIIDDLMMPGFVENPFAWMARADLFVMSSRWEGSPNALIEAMATGTPAVSTDCPSGPREIIADSGLGLLVPVGDSGALGTAILDALGAPPRRDDRCAFIEATRGQAPWVEAYLEAIGMAKRNAAS